ncbi:Cullin domain containing protein [Cryptosporidium felis]|nr:Cullin domain containing protein [Cryptosporidium felis]
MIAEKAVIPSPRGPLGPDEESGISFQSLETWVTANLATKQFVKDQKKILDELFSGSAGFKDGTFNQRMFSRESLEFTSILETPEFTEALECLSKNGLSTQLLEIFLEYSLESFLLKEITFFWTTLVLFGEGDFEDSMDDKETELVGNVLSLHCCVIFGLNRLLWSFVLVLLGAASILRVPRKERGIFLYGSLSESEGVPGILDKANPFYRVMANFKARVRLLLSDSVPPNFDTIINRYLLGIVRFLSNKVMSGENSPEKSDVASFEMRETLVKILFGESFMGSSGRIEACVSKLEALQHYYEQKASKVLGQNGSFPSNLDFETLEVLSGLISCSELGSRLTESELPELSKGGDLERVRASEFCNKDSGSGHEDEGRICEILGVISKGPASEVLFQEESLESLHEFAVIHKSLLNVLLELVFSSPQNGDTATSRNVEASGVVSLETNLGDILVLMGLAGLGDLWRQRVASFFKIRAASVVSFLENRKTQESNLRIYSKGGPDVPGDIRGLLHGIQLEFEEKACKTNFRLSGESEFGLRSVHCREPLPEQSSVQEGLVRGDFQGNSELRGYKALASSCGDPQHSGLLRKGYFLPAPARFS